MMLVESSTIASVNDEQELIATRSRISEFFFSPDWFDPDEEEEDDEEDDEDDQDQEHEEDNEAADFSSFLRKDSSVERPHTNKRPAKAPRKFTEQEILRVRLEKIISRRDSTAPEALLRRKLTKLEHEKSDFEDARRELALRIAEEKPILERDYAVELEDHLTRVQLLWEKETMVELMFSKLNQLELLYNQQQPLCAGSPWPDLVSVAATQKQNQQLPLPVIKSLLRPLDTVFLLQHLYASTPRLSLHSFEFNEEFYVLRLAFDNAVNGDGDYIIVRKDVFLLV